MWTLLYALLAWLLYSCLLQLQNFVTTSVHDGCPCDFASPWVRLFTLFPPRLMIIDAVRKVLRQKNSLTENPAHRCFVYLLYYCLKHQLVWRSIFSLPSRALRQMSRKEKSLIAYITVEGLLPRLLGPLWPFGMSTHRYTSTSRVCWSSVCPESSPR